MIIYDLQCNNGHTFEGWFSNREAFEEQKTKNLINCPICNSSTVEMLPSSITIMSQDAGEPKKKNSKELSPHEALRLFHHYLDKNFEDVGTQFAEIALKIHRGEEDKRNIRGTTTRSEEDSLRDEGVEFVKVPLPKFDS